VYQHFKETSCNMEFIGKLLCSTEHSLWLRVNDGSDWMWLEGRLCHRYLRHSPLSFLFSFRLSREIISYLNTTAHLNWSVYQPDLVMFYFDFMMPEVYNFSDTHFWYQQSCEAAVLYYILACMHWVKHAIIFQVKVFWVVKPCRVVVGYQCFRGPCCVRLQSGVARMEKNGIDIDLGWRGAAGATIQWEVWREWCGSRQFYSMRSCGCHWVLHMLGVSVGSQTQPIRKWAMVSLSRDPATSPWRWRQHGPLKHWYPTTTLHGVATYVKASELVYDGILCFHAFFNFCM
jgi:hypothetical protein